MLSLVILTLTVAPLAPKHTAALPARVTWIEPAGNHALLGLEAERLAILDPATGRVALHDLPLAAGYRATSYRSTWLLYDREQIAAFDIDRAGDLRPRWTRRIVATRPADDPSDEVRIAGCVAARETVAVVDTSGAFALLDLADGKPLWQDQVPPSDDYRIVAGRRSAAVFWETPHEALVEVVDVYIAPHRKARRSTGTRDICAAAIVADGVAFASTTTAAQVTFTGELDRRALPVETRPGGAYVNEADGFGPLVWTVGKKRLTVTPLPEGEPYDVRTPRFDWETLWVTPGTLFAGNESALCAWTSADTGRTLQADGRPRAPHRDADGVIWAVEQADTATSLVCWNADKPRVAHRWPLAEPAPGTRFDWIAGRLLVAHDRQIRIHATPQRPEP